MSRTVRTMALALIALASGCHAADDNDPGLLRVYNSGSTPIVALTVLFPNGEVAFGDVPAGATTEYRAAVRGVYRYAAYRFMDHEETVVQPVIDWVGETPMDGSRFTYTIELTGTSNGEHRIELRSVATDN